MAVDHEFGGQHTEMKLSIVEGYLKAYVTALRPDFEHLWYVDAFAGTGSRTVRTERHRGDLIEAPVQESVEHRRGSAQIAFVVNPQFDFLLFVESNPNYADALRDLAARRLQRRIVVAEDNANSALKKMVSANSWHDKRAVVFLDPYGMEVERRRIPGVRGNGALDSFPGEFLFTGRGSPDRNMTTRQ
jgi:three-Cys-motif partner protein